MLKKIRCDLFKKNDEIRPPIFFHDGLNIILGSVPGTAGSIGKSTMLLIVDFVFGGTSYLDSDAVVQLDAHTIFFVFSFNGVDYCFARSTNDSNIVSITDQVGNVQKSIKIKDFTNWLAVQYSMNLPGLQFRNTLSRFFRIYGKNNSNERKPLQVRGGSESQKDAIHILITLFDYYSSVVIFEEQQKLAEEKISAFRNARRYEFIPSAVDGLTKYQENIAAIASLQNEMNKLRNSDNRNINEEEVEIANQANALSHVLDELNSNIRSKEDKLRLINLNIQQGVYPTHADLDSLQEFFPEVNLKKLVEIERFHAKIQVVLKEEFESAAQKIKEELAPLKQESERISSKLNTLHPSMAFSEEFLNAYSRLDRRITKLQDENEAFEERNKLQEEKQRANARYQEQMSSILNSIETKINNELERLNEFVTRGEYNAPELTIKKYDSYNFETPKDKGTGTNNRGMLLYDLAILNLTVLPAIAHDSKLFDSMSRPDVSRMLELYNKIQGKQIFISLDKTTGCSTDAQNIIGNRTVLKLDKNKEALFGEEWNKRNDNEDSVQ